MMPKHLCFLAFLIALAAVSILPAADFYYDSCAGPSEWKCIIIKGAIQSGDSQEFIKLILKDIRKFKMAYAIELSSPGGNIEEAISLARIIRSSYKPVEVNSPAQCASACFILFAAGVERHWRLYNESDFQGKTPLGLHRPSLPKDEAKGLTPEELDNKNVSIEKAVRSMMTDWDMPENTIELMFAASSANVYWLTVPEYNEIKPIQTAWEESVIDKCDIGDPRIACSLFYTCDSSKGKVFIDDFYANEKYARYPLCYMKYMMQLQSAFISDLIKKRIIDGRATK